MRWLSGDEARQREPLVFSDARTAIYTPEASHISAPPWDTVKSRSSTRLLRSPEGGSKSIDRIYSNTYNLHINYCISCPSEVAPFPGIIVFYQVGNKAEQYRYDLERLADNKTYYSQGRASWPFET
jgi:hypothetical protein